MNNAMVRDHLELARRHVAQSEACVSRQREIVAELERDGHDSAQARQLLTLFEDLQRLHVADRDRLEKQLAKSSD